MSLLVVGFWGGGGVVPVCLLGWLQLCPMSAACMCAGYHPCYASPGF
jgi:hypothetical protein